MILAFIPSPPTGVWHLGPLPIRAYALCIILGVVACMWIGERRWVARGGRPGTVLDVAVWAIPFGIVGARIYHVMTDPELYFGPGRHPIEALYIWNGGLGIWGAISLGALGAYIAARRYRADFRALGDALAPGLLVAQAIGRWGNWFNQELMGKPTDLPWGLEIDLAHRPEGYAQFSTFHPTFLYESLWDAGSAVLLIWLDRRFRLGHGRVIALYVMLYTAGRFWVEYLRIDTAHHFLGLRLNDWTSIGCFVLAAAYFWWATRRGGGREAVVQREELVPGVGGATSVDDTVPAEDADPAEGTEPAGRSGDPPAAGESGDPPAAEQPGDADDGRRG